MQPRVHVITLGVTDLPASRAFYGRLDWAESAPSNASIAFFDLGGIVLALFDRSSLAHDAKVSPDGSGFRGVTLAHNLPSKEAVDAELAAAVEAGATLIKPAEKASWGGYSGYFADPDGHLWEVAYNPFFPIDEDGRIVLPAPDNS